MYSHSLTIDKLHSWILKDQNNLINDFSIIKVWIRQVLFLSFNLQKILKRNVILEEMFQVEVHWYIASGWFLNTIC